tara:strand:- start:401 stop:1228 length:828 start_codon:yes stop_codon:yes gene_type:complete
MGDLKQELKERFSKLVSESSDQLSQSVSALFETTNISESDQSSFLTIIEATVSTRAVAIAEQSIIELSDNVEEYAEYVKESLEVKASEYGEYVKEEMNKNLNSYIEYVAEQYVKENELAVTTGLKAEMFESLVTSMKTIFVENNIVVPDEGVDIVKELQEELQEHSDTANKLLSENTVLKSELVSINRAKVISEKCAKLATTQKEKVLELSEALKYDDEFETKLQTIIEFASKTSKESISESVDQKVTKEEITESVVQPSNVRDIKMNAYVTAAK